MSVCTTHRPDAGKKVLRQLGSIRLMSLAAVGGGVFLAHKMMTTPVLEPETASSVVPETGQAKVPTHAQKNFPINVGPPEGNVMTYDQGEAKTLDDLKKENNAKIEAEASTNWLVRDIMGFVGGLFGQIS